jgi:four helix bundle protein
MPATSGIMASRLEDLIVWQLGDAIRRRVHEITSDGAAYRDFTFRDDMRDAASSITRNISEGYGRYRHVQFAYFLEISRASAFEVEDDLRDGAARRYWTADSVEDIRKLCRRETRALARFIKYLRGSNDPPE